MTEPKISPVHWALSLPVLATLVAGISAFAGTIWTGYNNTQLEQHKFEYELIQKAMSYPKQEEKAQELNFLLKVGLLNGLNEEQIKDFSKDHGIHLPSGGAAIRENRISRTQAKQIFNMLKDENKNSFYIGAMDEEDNLSFYIAVARFQKSKNLRTIDGLIGAETILAMWDSCHDACQVLLQYIPANRVYNP